MDILYSWTAYRSGASMTIEHSCGKITGVDSIGCVNGEVIAAKGNRRFKLFVLGEA